MGREEQQTDHSRRALVFVGTLLCILLAFFAVERRIAAYPKHDIAATTIVATGVQKPEQVAVAAPQTLRSPVLFLCVVLVFAAFPLRAAWFALESEKHVAFFNWAPTPLAVRPPPTL
ncbi:MAG TPA: hypothetical protein VHU44_17425 [Acidobacteriaceae bacterium]|jgi:hypothetical protein|nr:hypothetical protein [Acidobacteriaceae bacterium]